MTLLRNYIRGVILSEGMIKPESIENHFAIWTDWTPGSKRDRSHFVLYDTRKAKKNIEYFYPGRLEAMDGMWRWIYVTDLTPGRWEDMDQAVVAIMTCKSYSNASKSCDDAWEVVASAAVGGHGPTLYDLVMSISPGGLFSDRSSVSAEAHDVWDFYANNRPEIDKKVMDGARLTPLDKSDDCYTHDEYNELMVMASRKRAIDFIKKYSAKAGNWYIMDSFYEDARDESNSKKWYARVDLDKTHGRMFWLAYLDWYRKEIHPNTDKMERAWYEWKENHPVMEYVTWRVTDPDYLDIIYNTDYAVGSAQKMMANHKKMLEDIRNLGINYGTEEAVNRGFLRISKEFFDEHYHG